ncbi:Crp/Fnr family transcriptional regulator [Pedobacter gandavensis]|uniref:Crp/Fnr family transcriptional regulator n=1 Tax=Pedobacter gandavensis TaxID=2679963 RepID=A0ABR6EUM4_9SPHI|nr:Crp/Fnr family transcriptional regulator [Pedobacter gandavensis]MBB2148956.1 hypothetical protein [Pedobacter gandavensis]
MKNAAYRTLIEELEKYNPNMTTGLKLKLPDYLFEVRYRKGCRVLNYKQVQDSGLFIYKGSAMELSVNPITLEETAANFWFEKDFPYTTPGLFSRELSPSYIKLLEDTLFVGIPFSDFIAMKQEFPEVELLSEGIRSHYERKRHEFEEDFRHSAKHRVKRLEQARPNIYNLAEIQHIAQYHRISVKTLSRLRGK